MTATASIFDYTPEPEEGEPETHPLDGHWAVIEGKEVWIPNKRENK